MKYKIYVLVLFLFFNKAAFAAIYNPEKIPKKNLAKVSNVKRSWLDSKKYEIVAVNLNYARNMAYRKLAPGVYILEWRLTLKITLLAHLRPSSIEES